MLEILPVGNDAVHKTLHNIRFVGAESARRVDRNVRHMEERLTAVSCTICNRPVRLDECQLNDLGEPSHEACLAERRKEEIKKRKATPESE